MITITQTDDGTLDFVFECHCDHCGGQWEERFDSGVETFPGLAQIRDEIEESHAEQSPFCFSATAIWNTVCRLVDRDAALLRGPQ